MSRIEELERRVRQDPASITFGALAEEYRREGRLEDAVTTCRSGLERHPSYLSARVSLGRALQELGHAPEARAEFQYVLSLAPDNLAAIRGLAELHVGDESESPAPFAAPVAAAPAEADSAPAPQREPQPEPPLALKLEPPIKLEPKLPRAPEPHGEPAVEGKPDPDFAALDASFADADGASAAEAERAAQIERLEIWLAKLEQARESTHDRA